MNIVLLDERQTQSDVWKISSKRQLEHLQTHVDVKVGDKVIARKYAGTEIKVDGQEYTIVKQSDILAIVE